MKVYLCLPLTRIFLVFLGLVISVNVYSGPRDLVLSTNVSADGSLSASWGRPNDYGFSGNFTTNKLTLSRQAGSSYSTVNVKNIRLSSSVTSYSGLTDGSYLLELRVCGGFSSGDQGACYERNANFDVLVVSAPDPDPDPPASVGNPTDEPHLSPSFIDVSTEVVSNNRIRLSWSLTAGEFVKINGLPNGTSLPTTTINKGNNSIVRTAKSEVITYTDANWPTAELSFQACEIKLGHCDIGPGCSDPIAMQTYKFPYTEECSDARAVPVNLDYGFNNFPPILTIQEPVSDLLALGSSAQLKIEASDQAAFFIPNASKGVKQVDIYITQSPGQLMAPAKHKAKLTSPSNGYYRYNFTPTSAGLYYIIAVAQDHLLAKTSTVKAITVYEDSLDNGSSLAPANNTTTVDFNRYEAYFGDFDGDGQRDLYLHGLPLVILLHGDIITPITLPALPGFIYYGNTKGSFAEAEPWDQASIDDCLVDGSCTKVEESQRSIADFNQDGHKDIFIKSPDADGSSIVVSGTEGETLPQVLLEIFADGHVQPLGSGKSALPVFSGNLHDTSTVLVGDGLKINGQFFSRNLLTSSTDNIGTSVAKNESIATAPEASLPSPSLTAAQIAEIDRLTAFDGEFRVNEMGASTYNISLDLPVGTADVAPTISFNYNSQSGTGVMGLGWNLSAGGVISRCRQTLQVDKATKPISFSSTDRFCMNGQRLLIVDGGAYGAHLSKYHTDIYDGSVVQLFNDSSSLPHYFVVKGKDGSTSTYGRYYGSHHMGYDGNEFISSKTVSWYLSEFKDSVGNKITYHYERDTNYHRLSEIRYGYGSNMASGDDSGESIVVKFVYGERKISQPQWIKSVRFEDNSLLEEVIIEDNKEAYRNYKITYNTDVYDFGDDLVDRVKNITPCISEYCVTPLTLSWGHSSLRANGHSVASERVESYKNNIAQTFATREKDVVPAEIQYDHQHHQNYLTMDINGDGIPDIVSMNINDVLNSWSIGQYVQGKSQVLTSVAGHGGLTGDGTARFGRETPQLYPADINLDGRMDLVVYEPARDRWSVYYSRYDVQREYWLLSGSRSDLISGSFQLEDNVRFADINSDGMPDLIHSNNTHLMVHLKEKLTPSGSQTIEDINASDNAYRFAPAPISYPIIDFDMAKFAGATDLNFDGSVDFVGATIDFDTAGSTSFSSIGATRRRTDACSYKISAVVAFADGARLAHQSYPMVDSGWNVTEEFSPRQSSKGYYLPQCTQEEFRHRLIGPLLSDINGDGLSDLLWAFSKPSDEYDDDSDHNPDYYINKINYRLGQPDLSFGQTQSYSMPKSYDGQEDKNILAFQTMDLNFDGSQDLLVTRKGDVSRSFYWNGTTFETRAIGASLPRDNERLIDVNGDGYVDKVKFKDKRLRVNFGQPNSNNVIIRFTTGQDVKTFVRYSALNSSGIYTKLGGYGAASETYIISEDCESVYADKSSEGYSRCVYSNGIHQRVVTDSSAFYTEINSPFHNEDPLASVCADKNIPAQEYISAMPVVAAVGSSSPVEGRPDAIAVVTYEYEEARIQAGGRGMLGFKKMTTNDVQTGIRTTTEYRQDWPFMGTPKRTITTTKNGVVLGENTTSMGIFGVASQDDISTLQNTVASSGTAALGPLTLYTKESIDTFYSAPNAQLLSPHLVESDNKISKKTSRIINQVLEVDQYSNIKQMQTKNQQWDVGIWFDLQTQTTTNTYFSDNDGERLGRLKQASVETVRTNNYSGIPGTIIRTADFTYYGYSGQDSDCSGSSNLDGLLCSEKVTVSDTTNSKKPAKTLHHYDEFGNKVFTQSIAESGEKRVSALREYDEKGRYLGATYGLFSQLSGEGSSASPHSNYPILPGAVFVKSSEVITRSIHGVPLLSRAYLGSGANVFSKQAVTPFGIPYFSGDSTGAWEQTAMLRTPEGANRCPSLTRYISEIQKAGGAFSGGCFDKAGKAIGGYTRLLDGSYARTEKRYDVLGRTIAVSEPSKNTAPTLFTESQFDILGRPVKVTHPFLQTDENGDPEIFDSEDGTSPKRAITTVEYLRLGIMTTSSGHTNKANRVKYEAKNALDQLVSVVEQYGAGSSARTITYRYDVLGKLRETNTPTHTANRGNIVTIKYNGLGQKIEMDDPDKGVWKYEYNSFGDLIEQTDAKTQVTKITYDFAGRKLTSTTTGKADANDNRNINSRDVRLVWSYDTAPYGLGKLAREQNETERYAQHYQYDALGRASTTVTTMPGKNEQLESFYQKQTYDQYGRPFQTFDAARVGPQYSYNGVQNVYNTHGYLSQVRDAANNGAAFYTVTGMDARGNVTTMNYGDGSAVTNTYNSRTGFLESIRRTGVLGNTALTFNADWDHLGNIVSRSDDLYEGATPLSASSSLPETFKYDEYNRLEEYTIGSTTKTVDYAANDNIIKKDNVTYLYGDSNHAVTKVGNREFKYDANGNALEEKVGSSVKKQFLYSAKDQAIKIEANGHISEFFYGTAGRFKRIDTSSEGKVTTLYIGSIEKVYNDAAGTIQFKRSVAGVSQVIHQVEANGRLANGVRHFLFKDHLGSVVAINKQGAPDSELKRLAYDPWGARREINSSNRWTMNNMALGSVSDNVNHNTILGRFAKTKDPVTNRGFTGHEMLDEVGIIHMNGRIYDASIGRFLQADPNIDGATTIGGFNRYSYVKNNPLNATDPTGYFLKSLLKKIGGNKWLSMIISTVLSIYCLPCAMAFNAAVTYAVTGDIGAAFVSFVASALSPSGFSPGAIIMRGALHGMAAKVQGGKFLSGAAVGIAGGAKFGSHAVERVISAAVIGGTVSKLTGSKFANGAATSAFSALMAEGREPEYPADELAKQPGEKIVEDEKLRAEIDQKIHVIVDKESLMKAGINSSATEAAQRLHNSGLYDITEEYGIELWAVIDKDTFDIRSVGTGYSDKYARGLDTVGGFSPGDSYWHTHPSSNGLSYGDIKWSVQHRANWGMTKGGWAFASSRGGTMWGYNDANSPWNSYSDLRNAPAGFEVMGSKYQYGKWHHDKRTATFR